MGFCALSRETNILIDEFCSEWLIYPHETRSTEGNDLVGSSGSLHSIVHPLIMSEPLSNIEKELAELVEEETTDQKIYWDNIIARASPPLRILIESKMISEGFTSQPMAYLVDRRKRDTFQQYREQMRKWKRQKEAKARALLVAKQTIERQAAAAAAATATATTTNTTTIQPKNQEGNKIDVESKEGQDKPAPTGGSLSTLTNEGVDDDDDDGGFITEDEGQTVEKKLPEQNVVALDISNDIIQSKDIEQTALGEIENPLNGNMVVRKGTGDKPQPSFMTIDESLFSYAEMDLAVLLEEWKRLHGHRKIDFNKIKFRGCNQLKAVLTAVNMQLFIEDPIKAVVGIDRFSTFRLFRRNLASHLSLISRGDDPMTVKQRLHIIHQAQNILEPHLPNTTKTSPGTLNRPKDRKRKALVKSLLSKSPTPRSRSSSPDNNDDDDEDQVTLGEIFGLTKAEEELAWILEELKMTNNMRKGVWGEVERRASDNLKNHICNHRNKVNFTKVPLRFLIKRLNVQAFKGYRELIQKEFLQGKKRPPVESGKVRIEGIVDEKTDNKVVATIQGSPKRTKQGRKAMPELTHDLKELAELAIQYDDGKEGIWVDIFENASPHLQVLLRTETPRTPSSPPESLVPLHLRPAFREYCATRMSTFDEGGLDELDEQSVADDAPVKHNDIATMVDILPAAPCITHRYISDALLRQKKRLNMLFSSLTTELEGFGRHEVVFLEDQITLAEIYGNEALEPLLTRLRSTLQLFKEQEEDAMDQHIKDYKIFTLKGCHDSMADLESIIHGYSNSQGQRIDAFLVLLHEVLGDAVL